MKRIFLGGFILLLLGIMFAGCTPQERSGVSPIPQNRPSNWETRPYGDMRN